MLKEITSDVLESKTITFYPGLNAVIGPDDATNSIGKSSFLSLIDFAYGGSTYIDDKSRAIENIGHHKVLFTFVFEENRFSFERNTETPKEVGVLDSNKKPIKSISLAEYHSFLKSKYLKGVEFGSFRSIMGCFSRYWGKSNYDVEKPLHSHHNESASNSIERLFILFDKYKKLNALAENRKKKKQKKAAFNSAYKRKLIKRVRKKEYLENETTLEDSKNEIVDIKENLSKHALNIKEIINRDILELKKRKDDLLASKNEHETRLIQIDRSISQSTGIRSRNFSQLVDFFPDIDSERLERVEEFHNNLGKILRKDLKKEKAVIETGIGEIAQSINGIDLELSVHLKSLENPSVIIDRVFKLVSRITKAKRENDYFQEFGDLEKDIRGLNFTIQERQKKISQYICNRLNRKIEKIYSSLYSAERKSPKLAVVRDSYSFTTHNDSGTGKSFANLIALDLAIFSLTPLPVLMHDSLLYKNIETDAVSNIINEYSVFDKQIFISIDEISKYNKSSQDVLNRKCVLRLSNESLLYVNDWRSD